MLGEPLQQQAGDQTVEVAFVGENNLRLGQSEHESQINSIGCARRAGIFSGVSALTGARLCRRPAAAIQCLSAVWRTSRICVNISAICSGITMHINTASSEN